MELDTAKASEHESIFTFKMAFLECLQTVFCFYDYSAYKIKVLHSKYQRTLDFTTSTMTSTRKCLSYSGLCRSILKVERYLLVKLKFNCSSMSYQATERSAVK